MIIKYKQQGPHVSTPLIICHGLFGSKQNWNLISKELSKDHQTILIDSRNHGESFHHKSMSYREMAIDIINLMDHLTISKAIIVGHSMGGKIAMALSQLAPERISKQIIIDIAPKQYPDHHTSIIKSLQSINLNDYTTRSAVGEALKTKIPNEGLRQFLIKNIAPKAPLKWQINLDSIATNYHEIMDWPQQFTNKSLTNTLFIRGTESNYINESDIPIIKKIVIRFLVCF